MKLTCFRDKVCHSCLLEEIITWNQDGKRKVIKNSVKVTKLRLAEPTFYAIVWRISWSSASFPKYLVGLSYDKVNYKLKEKWYDGNMSREASATGSAINLQK